MKSIDHLSVYDLVLTTRAPLYIGSGNERKKTEYLFDSNAKTVSMIDTEAFFEYLYKKQLADRYERFVLSGDTRLWQFFKNCGISEKEQDSLSLYKVSAADALDEVHSLKEIHTFMRDSRHRVYIPGSSVKGALRTVILTDMIFREKKGIWPDCHQNKDKRARQMQTLEGEYLNTVSLKPDKYSNTANDPVNSILRGISISDSEPISHKDMILVGKIDVNEKGSPKELPICRECIRPGTELKFRLTLDHSVLPSDFTGESLMQMIRRFDAFYQKTFLARFKPPSDVFDVSYQDALILGGGAGFFSKTLVYPYLGTDAGMRYTETIMTKQFSKHHHEKDISEHGISPHTMKYGRYRGKLYHYGVCGVQIR
ncbi:MAG: type III-A CRISPR-associated RAMP protein Csm5 [Clostridia bacterium]|nr:type III-A CRISPR-associated RAMP protein Csm5 [Clostridia bacterium]